MELNPENCALVTEFIHQVYPDMKVGFSNGVNYDSINLPEGYELFSRDFFETELKKLINSKPWVAFRNERDKKLTETDWTQTNDIIMENDSEWKVYRQSLRDIPSTTENPENPVWPERPGVNIDKTIQTKVEEDLQAEKAKVAKLELLIEGINDRMTEHERQTGFRM
tara:strand:- start:515 stop:1015 length:501 start_codon:yes stop_codon:yes gene_type:complete